MEKEQNTGELDQLRKTIVEQQAVAAATETDYL